MVGMSTPDITPADVTPSDIAPLIVAIGHPSLHHLVPPFVEVLRDEPRRFDRAGIDNPKPFPSLLRKLADPQRRRFGAMLGAELVGMASLADDGEVAMAVVACQRNRGIGSALLEHLARTADRDGYRRLVMETSRRSRPIGLLGRRFGWTAHELAHGRIELSLRLDRQLTG